jgi:lysophospholipase L1-like esterase
VAQELIAAFQQIIARSHAKNILVYGGTILPFGGNGYGSAEQLAARQTVNEWIRTSGAFDAVIDFDAAMRDPARPDWLLAANDTGDHLHPNETGYRVMAGMIDLALFTR